MHHADLPPPSLLHRLVPSSCFFFQRYGAHRDLHSFPTRRSSDLWTWRLAAAPLSPVTESAQTTRGRQPGCPEATRACAAEEDETMVNKVVLIGNLGRDPELIHTQGGRALARLWVATNEMWTKDGQRQRHTEWHRVLVWGARAEHIAAQYRKGTLVYVDGPIRSRKPTDGEPRTEIQAQRLIPLGSPAQREAADSAGEAVPEELRDTDEVPF